MKEPRTRTIVLFNTMAQLVGRVVSSGTTFVITLILAHRLGASGYGDFTKVTTYVAFFYLLVDLGLNTAFLQKQEQDKRFAFNYLLGLRLMIIAIAIFCALAIVAFLPSGQSQGYTFLVRVGIVIYTISIVSQGIITTANVLFQKHLAYHRASWAIVAGSLVTLVPMVLFGGATVLGTIGIFLTGSLITAVISLLLLRPFISSYTPLFSWSYSKTLLLSALPLSLTLVFNIIYFRIDSVILTLTQSTSAVGIYNFAYKIFEFPLVLPIFFMNALFPIFLKEQLSAPAHFKRHIKQSTVLLFFTSIIITIAVWICAPLITILHSSFVASIGVLRILSLGFPFFFLSALTMWILITLHKHRALVIIYGSTMIGNIIADILFIPSYGFVAAAWITVIGEAAVLIISLFTLFKTSSFSS